MPPDVTSPRHEQGRGRNPPSNPPTRLAKVASACDRCKRQKLKCDVQRPCTLCVRSNAACAATSTQDAVRRGPRRKQREDFTQAREGCVEKAGAEGVPLSQGRTFVVSSGESSDLDPEPPDPVSNSTTHRARNPVHDSRSDLRAGERVATARADVVAFGGDSSAIGLTSKVFKFNDSHQSSTTSALPGGEALSSPAHVDSLFLEVVFPPLTVAEALVNSYFDTVHWFMFIFHEPSFRSRAQRLLSLGSQMKTAEDADFAALLLMVMALGAQYAGKNSRSSFNPLMENLSINVQTLVSSLIRQVRSYLLDSLEHCQIEAVQTCVLLGTYYIYHGNPNLSWPVLGLAVKTAYALGMHREVDWKGDQILLQSRKRAWGHTCIADTFTAVIYGRPSTVDRSFCDISHPDEFDDTGIPMPLGGYLKTLNQGNPISRLSYHSCKYMLYDIKANIVSRIYSLRARRSFQANRGGIQKLVELVQAFDKKLKDWRDRLPPFFQTSKWASGHGDPAEIFNGLHEPLPESQERMKEQLIMQVIALQLLHDYILILLHRPLLEYRMSSQQEKNSLSAAKDPFPSSFTTCVDAALRISHAPAHKFKYHCPMALITMQMFTAGVILCMPATMDPFSTLAHRTKGAVVRMIRAFKKLSTQSPVVAQSCTILEELMKVVLKRELELILDPKQSDDKSDSDSVIQAAVSPRPNKRLRMSNTRNQPLQAAEWAEAQTDESSQAIPEISQAPSASLFDYGTEKVTTNQIGQSNSTFSPEEFVYSQHYSFIDAEPDLGFTDAFGALEKVIYDFAPSEWMNPAWMHSYEDAEPYNFSQSGFGDDPGHKSGIDFDRPSNYYEMGGHSWTDQNASHIGRPQ